MHCLYVQYFHHSRNKKINKLNQMTNKFKNLLLRSKLILMKKGAEIYLLNLILQFKVKASLKLIKIKMKKNLNLNLIQ